jgi:hypothetical protein
MGLCSWHVSKIRRTGSGGFEPYWRYTARPSWSSKLVRTYEPRVLSHTGGIRAPSQPGWGVNSCQVEWGANVGRVTADSPAEARNGVVVEEIEQQRAEEQVAHGAGDLMRLLPDRIQAAWDRARAPVMPTQR